MKNCQQCSMGFEVTDEDREFYKRVSPEFGGKKFLIPEPSHCPQCRQKRRLAWRNERVLYNRACSLCKKSIISSYPENTPFPVYCLKCWWGDSWAPLSYGQSYNPNIPFLQQWKNLRDRVPQLAIQNDDGIGSENCAYCYDFSRGKNCYRMIGSWFLQDCYYGLNCNRSKNVVDCNTVSVNCEQIYECLDSQRLYRCAYLQNCEDSRDCFFGYDLKGCLDSFMCFGLRQKRFCILNESYSEEDYRRKMNEIRLGSHSTIQALRKKFDDWILKFPRKYANLQNCESCEGNNLFNCRKVLGYSVFDSEFSKFVDRSDGPKYCYDIINTGGPQWCLDCVTPDNSYMTHFSVWCWFCKHVLLSDNCHHSEQLLGCISMRRSKYCILNKAYEKTEYERLALQILQELEASGDWGNLLPISLSPFGYNETAATEYYLLTQEEVKRKGWNWTSELPYTTGRETIAWDQIPDDISEVSDSITKEVLACMKCQRNFKVIPAEVAFYKNLPAPLPRFCFDCRHLARFARKTPTQIWQRTCAQCGLTLRTTYSPDRPEKIYCEACYLKTIY